MNIVTKIVLTCANVAGYLCPLRYPGLINQLFSPGNELRRVVLNLGHFDFEIVSDFDIRISYFASLGPSTSVENPLQIGPFMQNKPNFRKSQMNANSCATTDYENKRNWSLGQNKANSNPIFKRMNVNLCVTGYYKSKPKALKKPPLVEVNSEPLRKDWRYV